jgi:hypothetical protein
MYKKNEIKIGSVEDSDLEGWKIVYGAYLEHHSAEWVIGGREEIVNLIEDLKECLKKLEEVKP